MIGGGHEIGFIQGFIISPQFDIGLTALQSNADPAAVADAGSGGSVWPNGFGSQPASGEAEAAPTFGIQPFKFGTAAGGDIRFATPKADNLAVAICNIGRT